MNANNKKRLSTSLNLPRYSVYSGWGGRIRTLEWRDQNPLPYRLATPHGDHIKNTTFCFWLSLLLLFSLYSTPVSATTQNKSNVLNQKSNTNTEALGKYESKLIQSSPNNSPIKALSLLNQSLIFYDSQNLFYGNEPINILNTEEGNLGINFIKVDNKDFYLASELGLFKNYRRIFNRSAASHIETSRKKIYLATELGIYETENSKESSIVNFEWKLLENSPLKTEFFTLNKSKSNIEFAASSENGFFYYNPRKKAWQRRVSGLSKDFQDSYGFGRFLCLKEGRANTLYLPSSSGLFISNDNGQSWQKNNSGLKSNPDGFYSLREIVEFQDKLFLISSTGLYYSSKEQIIWNKVPIPNSLKNSDFNEDYHDMLVDHKNDRLLVTNSQGQIFSIKMAEALAQVKAKKPDAEEGQHSIKLISSILNKEPDIREVHKAALKFSGLPSGKRFRSYKIQARLRNLMPNFEAFLNKDAQDVLSIETSAGDSFNSGNSGLNSSFDEDSLNRNDRETNAGIKFSWDLSRLIFDPEINDINTSARITANVRENLLTEVTQIYFSRKELLHELLEAKLENEFFNRSLGKKLIKLETFTAQLDARTGGWFSEQLPEDYFQIYS